MSDARHPPADETMPIRAFRRIGPVWAALMIFGFLLLVVSVSVFGGYFAGQQKHASLAATETGAQVASQYSLGLDDLKAGRYLIAAERFRYVLTLVPDYPGAAEKLAEAESRLKATTAPTVDPLTAPDELLRQARTAIEAQDWDRAISILTQLKSTHADYEPAQVKDSFRIAYQGRGVARINADRLQEGIFDLDRAETYGKLDEGAAAQRIWATQYIRGSALWGADWLTAIAIFRDLYLAAPYFHDTIFKLHSAYVGYGDALWAGGDPCGAVIQYANANNVLKDGGVEDKRAAAEEACASITATPGEGTPSVTPGESPTPSPTATPGPTITPGPSPTQTPAPITATATVTTPVP